ncbi:MAG: hypothetical protein AAGI01_01750 [Myxococcota bacterium]
MPKALTAMMAAAALVLCAALAASCRAPTACSEDSGCFVGELCVSGQCVDASTVDRGASVCSAPREDLCDGVCVDTRADRAHCGACGVVCEQGFGCARGQCVEVGDCRAEGSCFEGSFCDEETGQCEAGCSGDAVCGEGSCDEETRACACDAGARLCDAACVLCPGGDAESVVQTGCLAGSCVAQACAPGFFLCAEGCCEGQATCSNVAIRARVLSDGQGEAEESWASGAIEVSAFDEVILDFGESDVDVTRRDLFLVEAPPGGRGLKEESTTRSAQQTTFVPKLVGRYVFEVLGYTGAGVRACAPARLTIEAAPDADTYVEMRWETHGDANLRDMVSGDVDLHYLEERGEWTKPPWAIFWFHPMAIWSGGGDPVLGPIDDDGLGPEVLRHDDPAPSVYAVGVHYFEDAGLGPSFASVRIWRAGEMVLDMQDRFLEQTEAFWLVAQIDTREGVVREVDEVRVGFPMKGE